MSKPNKREFRAIQTLFYSTRGTCDRLRIATTLWSPEPENIFLAGGYNGAPAGHPSCDEEGHLMIENHCMRTIHSEENALLNCFNSEKLVGGTATILGTPCYRCAIKLVAKKIGKLEFYGEYKNYQNAPDNEHIKKLFKDGNVEVACFPPEELVIILKKCIGVLQSKGGAFQNFPNDFLFSQDNL